VKSFADVIELVLAHFHCFRKGVVLFLHYISKLLVLLHQNGIFFLGIFELHLQPRHFSLHLESIAGARVDQLVVGGG